MSKRIDITVTFSLNVDVAGDDYDPIADAPEMVAGRVQGSLESDYSFEIQQGFLTDLVVTGELVEVEDAD